jgi:hypothetical protein
MEGANIEDHLTQERMPRGAFACKQFAVSRGGSGGVLWRLERLGVRNES